ncbi:MAG: NHLP bacteriocin export ABC transporter permease/ATPase subunit [Clostridia bacterium]|nr:NHLP bacteriocin export ABC transporter permease/ATPase subunit [Clostridia bacterium]
MGWFEEQIKQRKQSDDELFADAFLSIADSVLGAKANAALKNDFEKTKNAIDEILHYYHCKTGEVPESIQDFDEQLEYLMRPNGIMRRTVQLDEGWYKDASGAMLGIRTDTGEVVALLPNKLSGYSFLDSNTGKKVKISKKNEKLLERQAICFYKPFPLKKLGIPQLLRYIVESLTVSDMVLIVVTSALATGIGMLIPAINKLLYKDVLDSKSMRLLLAAAIYLITVSISKLMMTTASSIATGRLSRKMDISVSAATMMRVLSLPTTFFKKYGSGELSSHTQQVNTLCSMLISTIFTSGLASLFSLASIAQIFHYAPALVVPALIIILVTIAQSAFVTIVQQKYSSQEMELSAKESGMVYALISGVQKVRLAGAEKRMFSRWANLYAKRSKLTYQPTRLLTVNSAITTAISLIGTIVMYQMSVLSRVSVPDYMAFNSAYGVVTGAFMSLASTAMTFAEIGPVLKMAKPILEAEPEVAEGKRVITQLNGNIEVSNVSFKYENNGPLIVNNLSLKIKSGQYVAIVGTTGCGKSTLIRLMLGFEKPQKGAIYYDGKDLSTIDLKSLHRKIGTVMQDGKLFQGDIFSNITISAPWLTMDDAWEAAEYAGIADDIRQMPMGMFTLIAEGSGGISGGQKQRLMIARAVAPKPRILIFDEATSALDNITQKKISEFLDQLKCTRLVVAHRLSTIRQCDRIIVLDKGRIVEDGTYDELIKLNGFFKELVERQQINPKQEAGEDGDAEAQESVMEPGEPLEPEETEEDETEDSADAAEETEIAADEEQNGSESEGSEEVNDTEEPADTACQDDSNKEK